MAIILYDENKNQFTSLNIVNDEAARFGPFRTFADGRLGGAYEQIIYLRNNDPTVYYTNVTVTYKCELYDDSGEYGNTGWSVKYLYGERRPTEAEWDNVRTAEPLSLPDIGTIDAADTYTYHPIWIRVYCPGNISATIRDNQRLLISYYDRKVQA